MANDGIRVKVWGAYACFTRPELKTERVSYSVPTPSAARGVLEAVLFRPEFRWAIEQIEVLNQTRFVSIRRNEVQDKVPAGAVRARINAGRDPLQFPPLYADSRGTGGKATQRATLALADVAYIISARAIVHAEARGNGNTRQKYEEMFARRLRRGQCFQQPYLGCREFAAYVAEPDGNEQPIDNSADLGLMLYDIAYGEPNVPVFFHARMDAGVIDTTPERALSEIVERERLGLC